MLFFVFDDLCFVDLVARQSPLVLC